MHSGSTPPSRARLKVAMGVSAVLLLGLLIAWQAKVFLPGCSTYLEGRPEVGTLPPGATIIRQDLTGDGHGAVALDGGIAGGFFVNALGPADARWDFTMPVVDQETTDAVVDFYASHLAAQGGWTPPGHLGPNDWTWRRGDLNFNLNAPNSSGCCRASSLVSWTRSWEVTETVGGERTEPPECKWDGQETSFGHVA